MIFAVVILLSAVSGILADGCHQYCSNPVPEGCCERLGLNHYRDSDVVLTASSSWDDNHGPQRAGLFATVTETESVASWSAETNDANQWIQADFGSLRRATGILLQGRGEYDGNQWVTSFRVLFSEDGDVWYSTAPIDGTFDHDTVQRRYFDHPIVARYFRVNPISWNNHVSLRFDLLGCHVH